MSEGYARQTALVGEESNRYDRALDVTIALTITGFLLGMLTLVKVVGLDTSGGALGGLLVRLLAIGVGGVGFVGLLSWLGVVSVTSRRVRGVATGLVIALLGLVLIAYPLGLSIATLLGVILLIQAGAVGAAGVVSWVGTVETAPSPSAGLLAGGAFAFVGILVGSVLGGTVGGGEASAYLAGGLAGGLVLGVLTVVPREDLGSTLPVAVLVGLLGVTIATGSVGLGWQWSPSESIDGTFTGGVVVPLFVVFGSLVSSWAAAKCRAGFGARGRQYGAFVVVNLNALMMVTVMVSIVAFVTIKGLGYAMHGFTIGAPSALVVLAPVALVVTNWARTPAGTDEWHAGARQFVRILPLAAVGSLAALLVSVVVTGRSLEVPYTYTVYVNRQPKVLDTSVSVTPGLTVGTLLVVFVGLFVFVSLFRKYGSLRDVGTRPRRLAVLRRATGLAVGAMGVVAVVFAVFGKTPLGVPLADTVGLALVAGGGIAGVCLPALALAGLFVGSAGPIERTRDNAQWLTLGLFGGLGLLAATVLLEPFAGVNPTVAGVDLVPAAALAATLLSLAVATITAVRRRSATESRVRRALGEASTLGAVGTAGFATLVAGHVALTGVDFTVGGVTIGSTGTLSWPMTMQAYIPLGAEPGGILPAVVGTIWLVVGASLFAVPLGVGAAIFLTEYAEQGKFTALVEVATNALWSTPSVVFGLFGAAFLIPRISNGQESLLAGMLVLGFMLLPLVLITSREAIKSVPDEYRDASAALGVSRWETIRSVVLPASLPGVITGVILGVGRIAGETAPLILVLGSTLNASEAVDVLGGFRFIGQPPFVANDALLQASASLPTQVWAVIAAGVSGSPSMGWGSALVLLMVVLTFYTVGIITRTYFRRKLNYE